MEESPSFALPNNAVQIRNLSKIYNPRKEGASVQALNAIDLDIPRGSVFGLLGPNGAGKSTIINILAGLVIKSEGEVKIWDYDIDKETRMARASIGIVPQEVNLDAFFSPKEVLEFQAGLYGVPKPERQTQRLLEATGLSHKADSYARSLSGGMKRRLLIAKALVHSPPILVLDEPTAGVDVELRRQLWSYINQLNKEGVTIVLTTHYLEEAEELCDRIAIIDHGQVVACEETRSLVSQMDRRTLRITLADEIKQLSKKLKILGAEILTPRELIFSYSPSQQKAGDILSAISDQNYKILDVISEESRLEDIFIKITGLEETKTQISGSNDPEAGGASLARGRPPL
ncbi:MAG: ABC transporter ATP-binding protein [Rhodospirillaceae bacterium]